VSQKLNWTLHLLVCADDVNLLGTNEDTIKRSYVISWRVAGSFPDEVIKFFFQFTSSFQPYYGLGVYSASNRNEYQHIFRGV
jgi:hypothetical protein